MRFAYADPPYVGQARRHYGREEVDHAALIAQLELEFPDGWALSCSSPSLRALLPLCPESVRVMAWVKPFCSFKKNVNPAYAWEPVLVVGGRQLPEGALTIRDWISESATTRRGLSGVKPDAFSFAVFLWLGAQSGDEMVDLFPGSGAVGKAWAAFKGQVRMLDGSETPPA